MASGTPGTKTRLRYLLLNDVPRMVRYGANAPRVHELVWVDPCSIRYALLEPTRSQLKRQKGHVVGGDWDLHVDCIDDRVKFRICYRRWRDGLSWEDAGAYDDHLARIEKAGGRYDGCVTREDVIARYAAFDEMFNQVVREGGLRTRDQLTGRRFREAGGIGIHIGRNGQPIWGFDGSHRLAAARVLALPVIPATLGAVHAQSVKTWRHLYRVSEA